MENKIFLGYAHSFHFTNSYYEYEIITNIKERRILPINGYVLDSVKNFIKIKEINNFNEILVLPYYVLKYGNNFGILGGKDNFSFKIQYDTEVFGPFETKEQAEYEKELLKTKIEIAGQIYSRFS